MSDWLANGWLAEHRPSRQQIEDLFAVVARDLADCRTPGLSSDWWFIIAYNAALQLSVAALAASGYRASRESHHYRVIQSLAFTVGADQATVRQLDRFRKKRNVSGYESAGVVSDQEADEMVSLAARLRREVKEWLRANHPELWGPSDGAGL